MNHELLSEMKLHFFQDTFPQALDCAARLLQTLDPDDDDDAETIYEILYAGLHSGHGTEFTDFLNAHSFDASLTWPGKGGIAVLYANSGCSDPVVFPALERLGMDPALPDQAGNTVLHLLAGQKNSSWFETRESMMAELLRERADCSAWMEPNAYGATPLHLAVLNRHRELLQALLNKGVDPDLCGGPLRNGYGHVVDFNGVTALMLACTIGDLEAASLLLAAGARDDLGDSHGRVAGHYALEIPNQHICPQYYASIPSKQQVQVHKAELLGRLGVFDAPDDCGVTPLLKALTNFRFDAGNFAPLLIERGADVNRADNCGNTPLMAAAKNGHKQAVKALITAGADLDAQNNRGENALLLAVRGHDEKIARLLLKHGARANLTDQAGCTAGEVAAQQGLESVLELLAASIE